jgi:hypothetical protein
MAGISIENHNTLRAAIGAQFNLFVGAGFSIYSQNALGQALPLGEELRDIISDQFGKPELKSLKLPQVCTIIETTHKSDLDALLTDVFTVATYNPAYDILPDLPISAIFTTNIDNLIPMVFANSNTRYLNDILLHGPSFAEKTAVDFIALHGSVIHDEGFTFNPVKIASAFSSDPDRWHTVTQRLQRSATVFCGYGMEDAGVLESLSPSSSGGREHKEKWILLHRADMSTQTYFKALGFHLILGETLDFLDWVKTNTPPKVDVSTDTPFAPSHPIIQEHLLPQISRVPVRPIRDFYSGASPLWDDIFSNRIFKTSHYAEITDAIHSGKHVAVLGMFASGKTTLMMQIAAAFPFNGLKLVCSSLTAEKALLMGRVLNGRAALIFLDDFADDMAAFKHLATLPNVQIVGFERNYSYDGVSHLMPTKGVKIIECTGLNEADLQGLFQRMPPELRKPRMVSPRIKNGLPPSLYEIVEENMLQSPLRQRFVPVLQELEPQDVLAHDFLVMCCYVHDCRTPVSLDMAFGFLRNQIGSYSEIHDLVKRLNSLVVYDDDKTVNSEQDYFVPRSSIVSAAVLDSVQPKAFQRMLLKFHQDVSRLRIVRFDVFRRHAFDEYFATKAFPNWADGIKYYELLVSRDSSPFLYQQAALYLGRLCTSSATPA